MDILEIVGVFMVISMAVVMVVMIREGEGDASPHKQV